MLDNDKPLNLSKQYEKSSFTESNDKSYIKFDPRQLTFKMKENLNSILKSEFNTSIEDLNFSSHV